MRSLLDSNGSLLRQANDGTHELIFEHSDLTMRDSWTRHYAHGKVACKGHVFLPLEAFEILFTLLSSLLFLCFNLDVIALLRVKLATYGTVD